MILPILIVIAIIIIFLVSTGEIQVLFNGLENLINQIKISSPAINQAAKDVCNIDNMVLEQVVNKIDKLKPNDTKIQNIIILYKSGEKLTNCDVAKLVSYLTDKEGKRPDLNNFVCNGLCAIHGT